MRNIYWRRLSEDCVVKASRLRYPKSLKNGNGFSVGHRCSTGWCTKLVTNPDESRNGNATKPRASSGSGAQKLHSSFVVKAPTNDNDLGQKISSTLSECGNADRMIQIRPDLIKRKVVQLLRPKETRWKGAKPGRLEKG